MPRVERPELQETTGLNTQHRLPGNVELFFFFKNYCYSWSLFCFKYSLQSPATNFQRMTRLQQRIKQKFLLKYLIYSESRSDPCSKSSPTVTLVKFIPWWKLHNTNMSILFPTGNRQQTSVDFFKYICACIHTIFINNYT